MSALQTDDPARAARFYGAVFGWETEAFGPATLFRLPGYVGGEESQPVPRDVVAVMVPASGDAPTALGHGLLDRRRGARRRRRPPPRRHGAGRALRRAAVVPSGGGRPTPVARRSRSASWWPAEGAHRRRDVDPVGEVRRRQGRRTPPTGASGTTPAQAGPATSSGPSSGQSSEIRSDQSSIGSASTSVAASSALVGRRTSATRPGSSRVGDQVEHALLVVGGPGCRSRRGPPSGSGSTTRTRCGPRRARRTAVTASAWAPRCARRRIQRDPVEPWQSTRSPSRITAVGMTTGVPSSATSAKCRPARCRGGRRGRRGRCWPARAAGWGGAGRQGGARRDAIARREHRCDVLARSQAGGPARLHSGGASAKHDAGTLG